MAGTAMATTTPMDVAINNKFIDSLAAQLDEKKRFGLSFPDNYSVANALNSAYLIIQDMTVKRKKGNECVEERVLDFCTKQSIASSLLDMAVQALNPVKKQCYFVAFGDKLTLMRSYQGTMAVAKRVGATDIRAEVIYEGDVFRYHIENGYKVIDEHTQDFKNIDNEKIVGAYAIVDYPNFTPYVEVMNINQIKKAWSKGKADLSKANDVHNEFADQMAKKTVINRACKNFINSSDDGYLMETFDRTTDNEKMDIVAEQVAADISQNANSVSFEQAVIEQRTAPRSVGDVFSGGKSKDSVVVESFSTKVEPEIVEDEETPDFMK